MAGEIPMLRITRASDVDLSASTTKGLAALATASNGCNLAGADAQGVIGVIHKGGKITEATSITVAGTAKARAGAAFAVGARLTTNAAGKFITQAGAVGSGLPVNAIALQAAAAVDELVEVLLTQGATI